MSTRRVQLSVGVRNFRLHVSSLLLCQDLHQCWLDKISKAFSSKSGRSSCGVGSTILLVCWVRTAANVSKVEGLYASHFLPLVIFRNFILLLFFVALPSLIDNLLHRCQLKGSFYECLWRGDKGSSYRNISTAYYRWTEFWHYIYCFVRSGEVSTVKGNKHTHTQTHTPIAFELSTFCIVVALPKKWSFSLNTSSVDVTKSVQGNLYIDWPDGCPKNVPRIKS